MKNVVEINLFNSLFRPMTKKHCFGLLCVLTAITLATGCKPKTPIQTSTPSGYFQTPFQSESQFIVEAIVSDLAEQIYYAANNRLPEKKYFSVTATESPGSPTDAPEYQLQINLDERHAGLNLDVNMNGPIWSPEVYRNLAATLARTIGLKGGTANKTGDTTLLAKLLDGTPETIEQANQSLSEALEKNFTNSELHEQAALLLGAFMLREHSGKFFEIRSPLSRMTAHLAMARLLNGADSYGVNGRMAEATLLTLVNDQAPALEKLKSMDTNNTAVASMVRVLHTRNTGDFRVSAEIQDRSRVETVAWFVALADYVSAVSAWVKLDEEQRQTGSSEKFVSETGDLAV
jgi:hypothetical protein